MKKWGKLCSDYDGDRLQSLRVTSSDVKNKCFSIENIIYSSYDDRQCWDLFAAVNLQPFIFLSKNTKSLP